MPEPDNDDVLLICYPPDVVFERGVRTVLDGVGGVRPGAIEAVVLKLHECFPELRIVVHEPNATDGAHQATWVVFRDLHERRRHSRERHEAPRPRQVDCQPVALVVDDEPLVRSLIAAVLATRGWRVLRASGGADALAQARCVDLDLLVTDYGMADMDGGTLARRLRARDPDLPVLVVSGQPEEAIGVEGHGYLSKPFRVDDLALRIEMLTGRADAQTGTAHSAGYSGC